MAGSRHRKERWSGRKWDQFDRLWLPRFGQQSGSVHSGNHHRHNQTIWKDAKWGAVNVMGSYAYLFREPWYVAAGAPKSAHDDTIFVNLRYTLPGAPPAIK